MNKKKYDILNRLYETVFYNQRRLSEETGYSLGSVNQSLNELIEEGFLTSNMKITEKARGLFERERPRQAVLLAAGFGMRMVPINMETPKAFLEVYGERLIERLIRQLHEVGVKKIYVVVGFLKEQFEYLIDEFGVELIVNPEYGIKNNLHSVFLAREQLSNAYVVPCDLWCKENPFQKRELYSWYMVSETLKKGSLVCVNRKMELKRIGELEIGNRMVGIAYLNQEDGIEVAQRLAQLDKDEKYEQSFWEEALYEKKKMILWARVVQKDMIIEVNTFEQLRELDKDSQQLKTDSISIIEKALKVEASEITDIQVLKKGMTNRSFLFSCQGKQYIMRIPGEGTDRLIDREKEYKVYQVLKGRNICDEVVYMNPENGYKITEYLEGVRVCDAFDKKDVEKCMKKLKSFHQEGLKVGHKFDVFEQILFYESLWEGKPCAYRDYEETKKKIFELKEYIDHQEKDWVLAHIDAVPDNFLFGKDGGIRLIDWEYAGMQDPHIDLAMFSIYALYEKKQVDELLHIYFQGECEAPVRAKIYCYIAACGLLWSNWCEYKRHLGVEFGEYSLKQYRYAKEFYELAKQEMEKE